MQTWELKGDFLSDLHQEIFTVKSSFLFLHLYIWVQGVDSWASWMLGECSTAEPCFQPKWWVLKWHLNSSVSKLCSSSPHCSLPHHSLSSLPIPKPLYFPFSFHVIFTHNPSPLTICIRHIKWAEAFFPSVISYRCCSNRRSQMLLFSQEQLFPSHPLFPASCPWFT